MKFVKQFFKGQKKPIHSFIHSINFGPASRAIYKIYFTNFPRFGSLSH